MSLCTSLCVWMWMYENMSLCECGWVCVVHAHVAACWSLSPLPVSLRRKTDGATVWTAHVRRPLSSLEWGPGIREVLSSWEPSPYQDLCVFSNKGPCCVSISCRKSDCKVGTWRQPVGSPEKYKTQKSIQREAKWPKDVVATFPSTLKNNSVLEMQRGNGIPAHRVRTGIKMHHSALQKSGEGWCQGVLSKAWDHHIQAGPCHISPPSGGLDNTKGRMLQTQKAQWG